MKSLAGTYNSTAFHEFIEVVVQTLPAAVDTKFRPDSGTQGIDTVHIGMVIKHADRLLGEAQTNQTAVAHFMSGQIRMFIMQITDKIMGKQVCNGYYVLFPLDIGNRTNLDILLELLVELTWTDRKSVV